MLDRPVKLGIKKDLFRPLALSHRRIEAALQAYCNTASLLQHCKPIATLHNILRPLARRE
jgi:hypothetical protein